jgi:integrase
VMHAAGDENDTDAVRLRALIVVLWRAGLRISEALALTESDLDLNRGANPDSPRERRQAPRSWDGPLGVGATNPVAASAGQDSHRRVVLRAARPDLRSRLGPRWSALAAVTGRRRAGVR